jgi:hypothetical protein
MNYSIQVVFAPVDKKESPLTIQMSWWNVQLLLQDYTFQLSDKDSFHFFLQVSLTELIWMYFEQLLFLSPGDYFRMKKNTEIEQLFKLAAFSPDKYDYALIVLKKPQEIKSRNSALQLQST